MNIPKSEVETNSIIDKNKNLLLDLSNKDRSDDKEEIVWQICYELFILAGSFNHHINMQHRIQILEILVDNYENAVDPILQAFSEHSRIEYFDLVKAFIYKIANKNKE